MGIIRFYSLFRLFYPLIRLDPFLLLYFSPILDMTRDVFYIRPIWVQDLHLFWSSVDLINLNSTLQLFALCLISAWRCAEWERDLIDGEVKNQSIFSYLLPISINPNFFSLFIFFPFPSYITKIAFTSEIQWDQLTYLLGKQWERNDANLPSQAKNHNNVDETITTWQEEEGDRSVKEGGGNWDKGII